MLKKYKPELRSLSVISVISILLAIVLCFFLPVVLKLLDFYTNTRSQFFVVAIYVYAVPAALLLLGISLQAIKAALLEDRISATWQMVKLQKRMLKKNDSEKN